jgi:hypothetical protein
MAACMMSLFEIQKEQKRLATCSSTSTVLCSAKPKKEDTGKQSTLSSIQNIAVPIVRKSSSCFGYGFDVEFILQYCSFVV